MSNVTAQWSSQDWWAFGIGSGLLILMAVLMVWPQSSLASDSSPHDQPPDRLPPDEQ